MVYTEASKRATYKYRLKNIEKMRAYIREKSRIYRENNREKYNETQLKRYNKVRSYNEEAKRLRMINFIF